MNQKNGFTIVELLIVIVVIALLAAISIVAYNGIQDRARQSKIRSDLSLYLKAIQGARVNTGEQALRYVTNATGTSGACVNTANDIDLSDKTAASSCWYAYTLALNAISDASGVNIRSLADPWGRPYFLDENEKEGASQCGNGKDNLGVFPIPRVMGSWTITNLVQVPYITPGC